MPVRRVSPHLAALAAALGSIALLSGSATASGGYAFGQNVDPSLASTINDNQAGGASPSTSYHVLVFGTDSDLNRAWQRTGTSDRNDLSAVGAQSASVTAAQAAQLSAQPGVQYITADLPMAPTSRQSQPAGLSAAQLATLYPQIDGAPSLWSNGVTGAGVGIAVIDSGVTQRAEFGSRLVQVQLPTQDGTALKDNVGHGSAVAGVAAGQSPDGKYIGIAPGATLYAINVARSDGVYTSDVIAGLEWVLANAAAKNIDVVNLSLSQVAPSSYYTSTLDAVVDQLWKAGIVVVASSGNFGPNTEEFAPANDPWVITVGASDSNDTATTSDDTLAAFSSYGTTPDGFSKPEIVAPGRHIVTTIPADSSIAQSAPAGYLVGAGEDNYVRISGTSFSAPQVAGAAALLLQQRPNLSPNQVKWALTSTERSLAGSSAGALDLVAASNAISHPGNANGNLRWSSWGAAHTTNDFLNAIFGSTGPGSAYNRVNDSEKNAAQLEQQASISCAKARVTTTLTSKLGRLVGPAKGSPSPWQDCASKLDQAAAAWDAVAQIWGTTNVSNRASDDENSAASDWKQAAAAWDGAGNAANSAADTQSTAAAWDRAAAWDKAAAWEKAAAWDRAAAWDAAAWDHAAAWDAAAWDAAAWDAAAWDAAAWD
jgi:serine protease AprX